MGSPSMAIWNERHNDRILLGPSGAATMPMSASEEAELQAKGIESHAQRIERRRQVWLPA